VPVFAYRATDDRGRIVDGRIEARTSEAVVARLRKLAFYPLEIRPAEAAEDEGASAPVFGFQRRKKVLFFTGQLATLIEAGLPVDRSLAIAAELTGDRAFAQVIERIRASVEEGSTLADALQKEAPWFDELYVNMVRAGESGGALEVILRRLADFLEEGQKTRDVIVSSLAYPIFLVVFSMAAVVLIFVAVLPRFAAIFNDMGGAVPGPARFLMGVSDFLRAWWWAILLGVAGALAGFRGFIATGEGRLWWDRSRLSWPIVGSLMARLETARFARTLGTLLSSGVPVLAAVDIVGATIGNRHMASFIPDIRSGLKKGEGLVKPLRRAGVFPPLFVHMATVGEETGRLEEMLVRTATIFDRETESATKAMLALLEPVILVVMAVVIGAIIISILTAIFSVYKISL
jgi:general secretion pathway protein F